MIASGSLRTMKNSGINMAMRAHPLVLIQVMASATSFCHHPVDLTMSTLKLNQRKSSCLYIPPSFITATENWYQGREVTLSSNLHYLVPKELELVSQRVWKSGDDGLRIPYKKLIG